MNSSQILNIPIDPTHFADTPPPASEWGHLNRRLSRYNFTQIPEIQFVEV